MPPLRGRFGARGIGTPAVLVLLAAKGRAIVLPLK